MSQDSGNQNIQKYKDEVDFIHQDQINFLLSKEFYHLQSHVDPNMNLCSHGMYSKPKKYQQLCAICKDISDAWKIDILGK